MDIQEFLNTHKDRLANNGYTLDELVQKMGYVEARFYKKGVGQVSYAFIRNPPDDFTFAQFLSDLNWLLEYRYAGR